MEISIGKFDSAWKALSDGENLMYICGDRLLAYQYVLLLLLLHVKPHNKIPTFTTIGLYTCKGNTIMFITNLTAFKHSNI